MNLRVYVVGLIAKRRPEILPPAMREAFLNKNKAELEQLISEYKNWDGSIDIRIGKKHQTEFNESTKNARYF